MVRVPTYGELLRTVADLIKENKADRAELEATVGRLEKRVDRLELENATLRSRLEKNSKNSSKPPSSDSFSKPASRDRSLREPSGNPQGKQADSAGASLPMTPSLSWPPTPMQISLTDAAGVALASRQRQVAECLVDSTRGH